MAKLFQRHEWRSVQRAMSCFFGISDFGQMCSQVLSRFLLLRQPSMSVIIFVIEKRVYDSKMSVHSDVLVVLLDIYLQSTAGIPCSLLYSQLQLGILLHVLLPLIHPECLFT